MSSSESLHHAVLQALHDDTRVPCCHVGVTVDDGVVTLCGAVSNQADRQAAEEAVRHTPGVHDVVNDVVVAHGTTLLEHDSCIAQDLRHALRAEMPDTHERIQTSVSEGWVTLSGRVGEPGQRQLAEQLAYAVNGVYGVTNLLRMDVPGALSHAERSEASVLSRADSSQARNEKAAAAEPWPEWPRGRAGWC